MKNVLLALVVAAAALVPVSAAGADPVRSPRQFSFEATCTGLGAVTIVNIAPAHTEAFQVVGTNTVVLIPFNGAPGIIARATAAGTTCTLTEVPPPNTFPVVIVNQ
jgi:hypothetical protein